MLRLNFVTSCVNLLFSLSSVFGISGSLPTLTSSFLGFPGADLLPVTTHLPIAAANPLLIGNLKRIKELTCLPSCPPSLISTDTHPAKAPPGSFVLYSSRKLWLNTSPSNILDLSQCLLITLYSPSVTVAAAPAWLPFNALLLSQTSLCWIKISVFGNLGLLCLLLGSNSLSWPSHYTDFAEWTPCKGSWLIGPAVSCINCLWTSGWWHLTTFMYNKILRRTVEVSVETVCDVGMLVRPLS